MLVTTKAGGFVCSVGWVFYNKTDFRLFLGKEQRYSFVCVTLVQAGGPWRGLSCRVLPTGFPNFTRVKER